MILADAGIHKVVGVLFRTDLTDGLVGVLLSVGITVVVVAIPSWRKWSRRTPIGLNEQTIMLSTPRDLNH